MSEMRAIVRIRNTDLDCRLKVFHGLTKIKGISFMFSNAICNVLHLDPHGKLGELSPEKIKALEELLANPSEKIPTWMLNRRNDIETGKNLHVLSSEVRLTRDFDIKRLQKVRSRRGLRHAIDQPVRGQKTKSHFRKGRSVGVQKKKIMPAKGAKPSEKEKGKGKGKGKK